MAKIIHASVGVLYMGDKFLLCTRPIDKQYAGYWEFPGGKIEANENNDDALIRELYEELNILVTKSDIKPFSLLQHVYDDKIVNLNIFKCENWVGNIVPKEGQSMYWQKSQEVCNLTPQLPTTIKIIRLLNNGG
jgi:8-oxo-dGTP diphosphatase